MNGCARSFLFVVSFVHTGMCSVLPGLAESCFDRMILMVDSVAATVETVKANGGTIVQPIGMDAPEITARFSDPAGNVFGLYQEPA